MKTIITSTIILLISCAVTYANSQELEISVQIIKIPGTVRYLICEGEFKVFYSYEPNKAIYSKKLSTDEIASLTAFIEKCDLAKLKRRYDNRRIQDGYLVSYEIKVKGNEYNIGTFNVYQPTMISICEKLNELLPGEYHMYIPSKTDPGMISFDQIKDTEQVIKQ